jgi:anti-anti-sigma regulatory factor
VRGDRKAGNYLIHAGIIAENNKYWAGGLGCFTVSSKSVSQGYKIQGGIMKYRITQIEDEEAEKLILRLEGSFHQEGGERVEQLCQEAENKYGNNILIDVHGITYLDEQCSMIFCRLKNQRGITMVGCHLFNKKVMDQSEAN